MRKVFLSFFILIAGLHSTVYAGKSITATGMSFFEAGRESIAREKALDEARRSAIESAIGTHVESRSVVENYQIVRDQILSHSTGYLKNVEVLKEGIVEGGMYEVSIRADVEIADLVSDTDRFKKLLGWQKNPRVSVFVVPQVRKENLSGARKAADLLAAKMKQAGFRVFKSGKNDDVQMGLKVGVLLEHSTRRTTFQDMELTVNEVSLSSHIYRPGQGEILATASAVKSLPGESRLKAIDKATTYCVNEVWKKLASQLTRFWEKELYSQRNILLLLSNVPSHQKAMEVANILKSDVSGVVQIRLTRFKGRMAEYQIQYKGWPDHLVNELEMAYFRNKYFSFRIQQVMENTIKIKMK